VSELGGGEREREERGGERRRRRRRKGVTRTAAHTVGGFEQSSDGGVEGRPSLRPPLVQGLGKVDFQHAEVVLTALVRANRKDLHTVGNQLVFDASNGRGNARHGHFDAALDALFKRHHGVPFQCGGERLHLCGRERGQDRTGQEEEVTLGRTLGRKFGMKVV
jgi:hypothetical protein